MVSSVTCVPTFAEAGSTLIDAHVFFFVFRFGD